MKQTVREVLNLSTSVTKDKQTALFAVQEVTANLNSFDQLEENHEYCESNIDQWLSVFLYMVLMS